jgi:hypothetical protein
MRSTGRRRHWLNPVLANGRFGLSTYLSVRQPRHGWANSGCSRLPGPTRGRRTNGRVPANAEQEIFDRLSCRPSERGSPYNVALGEDHVDGRYSMPSPDRPRVQGGDVHRPTRGTRRTVPVSVNRFVVRGTERDSNSLNHAFAVTYGILKTENCHEEGSFRGGRATSVNVEMSPVGLLSQFDFRWKKSCETQKHKNCTQCTDGARLPACSLSKEISVQIRGP